MTVVAGDVMLFALTDALLLAAVKIVKITHKVLNNLEQPGSK